MTRVLAAWRAFRRWARWRTFRDTAALNGFLRRRDTATMECFLALSYFVNAWQVMSVSPSGRNAAPFLDTAIRVLVLPKAVWIVVLVAMGVVKIVSLIHGLIHNNFYYCRACISLAASFVWALVFLAIVYSVEPKVTAARYLLLWMGSMSTFIILMAKHRVAPAEKPQKSRILAKMEGKCGISN